MQVPCQGWPWRLWSAPTLRELSLAEESPVIRLADGVTGTVGRALNGEPRRVRPQGIKGRILKTTVAVITTASIFLRTYTVPGALLSLHASLH